METQLPPENWTKLRERVRLSTQNSHRSVDEVLVLAVSKTRPAADIRAAYACGLRAFGESYVQEALEKMAELEDLDLCWHFIGPVQSNKTSQIAGHFAWVHGVDRMKIARRLSAQRPDNMAPLQVCIQVNISGEASKSGTDLEQLPQLAQEIVALPRLKLRGLMGIPAAGGNREAQHRDFARLREALQQLKATVPGLDTLSMGMSADLEAAIAEGATIIRVGTALFGPRDR